MSKELSEKQIEILKGRCPECGSILQEVGDLADFDHNIVMCTSCDYTLMFND